MKIEPDRVRLRDVQLEDLPELYLQQLDPDANRLAAVIPRDSARFQQHWLGILSDSKTIARAITVDDELVGQIGCYPCEGQHAVGYSLAKAHWGRGIASRALALLLEQVSIRPIHARVAIDNTASIRVLLRCGFMLVGTQFSPEDGRFLACEECLFVLESSQLTTSPDAKSPAAPGS